MPPTLLSCIRALAHPTQIIFFFNKRQVKKVVSMVKVDVDPKLNR